MKVCVLSANLGSYESAEWPWAEQIVPDSVTVDIYRLNDSNFPPRTKAMTPALQCGIAKMFGWQLFPCYETYLWVDASCALTRGNEVHLWLEVLGNRDLALFKHPERNSVQEEYEFVKTKIAEGNKYLVQRYENEWLDQQYEYLKASYSHYDNNLYASTAFIYRPTARIQAALSDWWWHKSRFLLHDQLALPYVLKDRDIAPVVINQNYQKSGLVEFVRNKKR